MHAAAACCSYTLQTAHPYTMAAWSTALGDADLGGGRSSCPAALSGGRGRACKPARGTTAVWQQAAAAAPSHPHQPLVGGGIGGPRRSRKA